MRKLFILLVTVLLTTAIAAQDAPMFVTDDSQTSGRDNEYVCETGSVFSQSVFSQVEATSNTAAFCQAGYTFSQVADDYTATAPFSSMRFWGGDFYECSLAGTESFTIYIYDGDPSSGGTIIHTFTLDGIVTPLGVSWGGTDLYQIDIDFGTTISQLSGWIGVTRNAPSCSTGFAWNASSDGNSRTYDGSNWLSSNAELFFCLAGPTGQVPLSDYAIYFGIFLILAFTAIRFRRVFI